MTASVIARDLRLAHGDHIAIDTSTFELPEGAAIAVIGPNGSGKSTLLDAVAGLIRPTVGTIERLGDAREAAGVAYVLQSVDTPEHLPLSVREVVTMGRYRRAGLIGRLGASGRSGIDGAMRRTAVDDLAHRQLAELSGGQRQRVLVAQGLAADAAMLLLDEPMTGLDLPSQQRINQVIVDERDAGRTVIFSTHDLAEAARADVVVLTAGRVVAVGPPTEVLTEDNLRDAYRAQLLDVGGLAVLDDPHHHGGRGDRHDGHQH